MTNHPSSPTRRRRLASFVGALTGLALVGGGPAFAYWTSTDASNPAKATAASLSAPTGAAASADSSTAITITWVPASPQLTGAEYQVTRTAPGPSTVVCTVSSTAGSCPDTNLVPGTPYSYSIAAIIPTTSWQSSAITASAATPKVTPTVSTNAKPSSVTVGGSVADQGTISLAYGPTGTIVWRLYPGTDTTCSGTPVFTSPSQNVAGNSTYTSDSYTTTTPGSYIWSFSYSGDQSNNAVSECGTTGESLAVNQASPTLTTSASSTNVGGGVTDTATLAQGYNPTGTITYTLYGPSSTASCVNQVGQVTRTVNGNNDYTSPSITPSQAGTYWWIAAYSGDPNNQSTADTCGASGESSTVAKVTPSIATAATPSSMPVGGSAADQATITGGYNPTGTITWSIYAATDSTCTTPLFTSSPQTVNGNATYTTPNSFNAASVGTYIWGFNYSGDVNNNPVPGCGGPNETLTVTKASPSITAGGPASGVVGTAIPASAITSVLSSSSGSNAGGTVTFTVFGPQASAPTNCATGGSPVGTATTVSGNATYNPSSGFTPSAAGNYWWYAAYSGDSSNNAATSACGPTMSKTAVSTTTPTVLGQTSSSTSTATINAQTTSGANELIFVYGSTTSASPTASVTGSGITGTYTTLESPAMVSRSNPKTTLFVLQATGSGVANGSISATVAGGSNPTAVYMDVVELTNPVSVNAHTAATGSSSTATATLTSPANAEIAVIGLNPNNNTAETITPPSGMGLLGSYQSNTSAGEDLGMYYKSSAQASAAFGLSNSAPWAAVAIQIG